MNVLSIRGGGIRGLAPAQMFAEIEARTGRPIASGFDLIAGTSTGSILAVGLALNIPAKDLVKFYIEDGPNIFKRQFMHRLGLINSKYSSKVLRVALDKRLGPKTLNDCKVKVMIPASDVKSGQAKFFRSWMPEDRFVRVGAACQASASAPTYFDPMQWGNPVTNVYEDGGLFANNPALYALAEAQGLIGLPQALAFKNIRILDVACPSAQASSDTGKGILGFVPEAISMIMDLGMDADSDACMRFLGPGYMAVTPPLGFGASSALDDASEKNLNALVSIGHDMVSARVTSFMA